MAAEKARDDWMSSIGQLQKKPRNHEEEEFFQFVEQMEEDICYGVKLKKNGLYGYFTLYGGENRPSRAAFYLSQDEFLLTVLGDESGFLKELWQIPGECRKKPGKNDKENQAEGEIESRLEQIFGTLLRRGNEMSRQMGDYLIELERQIVTGQIDRNRNRAIFECKRSLVRWKRDYVQLLGIAGEINRLEQKRQEQKERLLDGACACRFQVYETRLLRLVEQIRFLYEELIHIREALNASLEYDQNRIMKVFTTVTTIFMPLTLVAGWYGMNFSAMPELTWKYGYLFVIVLSVTVIACCMLFFRKKKLL